MNRRSFLTAATGASLFSTLSAAQKGKVKITDVKCMIVRGTWDWNLIKIETDAGISGIGEAYWGVGIKDVVLRLLKQHIIGEDPLNVDELYHKMLMLTAGAGAQSGLTVTAASGIEIALWDLAGRILQTPSCNLLGGRFRDRVRFYRTTQAPAKVEDMGAWRALVQEAKAEKFGWTAFKFQGDGIPPRADPEYKEPGHDRYTRGLTIQDLRRIGKAMETVRQELGPDIDFGVEAHWKYDVRDAIRMAQAIEGSNPMWLEDPVPPGNVDAMARVTHAVNVPICTGENLYTRNEFRRLIDLQGVDYVHIDIPKSGGLLESKRIHDLAENSFIPTAAHNPASPVGTIASCHAAASMRDFRVHELAKYIDFWEDVVIHDGPIIKDGYLTIQDKPGLGIELNPDVVKKNLAPGEVWWG
jgi:L-alanine-DL-glutamate epimerase-like enolase superfamily enzyme